MQVHSCFGRIHGAELLTHGHTFETVGLRHRISPDDEAIPLVLQLWVAGRGLGDHIHFAARGNKAGNDARVATEQRVSCEKTSVFVLDLGLRRLPPPCSMWATQKVMPATSNSEICAWWRRATGV
jgi:hypothetical protein